MGETRSQVAYPPPMASERRREPRYPYRLPITLKCRGKLQETITEDVSYRGMFALTDEPPGLRQLIQVSATLTDSGAKFETHAMSVFVLERGNRGGRTPGSGLQFYAMAESVRKSWNAFIDSVRRKASPEIPASQPREHVRYRAKLEVRPKSVEDLLTLYTRDVSKGGMFLLTDKPFTAGSELGVEVFHPDSDGVFDLACIVRRVTSEPQSGIGVEFTSLDEDRRAAFYDFVHSAIPELSLDDLLVDEDDPNLE